MLVVGVVGWTFEPQHESKLSPAEQLTHFTLWTLYPSPLILGCDLAKADDFTVGLLCNDEVLAIHQDALGMGARTVCQSPNGAWQVWARPLEDGSKAVGLFNLNEMPVKVTAKWSELGLTGQQKVRDVWRQRDLGKAKGEFAAVIPRHGCLLLKITPSPASDTPKWGFPPQPDVLELQPKCLTINPIRPRPNHRTVSRFGRALLGIAFRGGSGAA